MKQQEFDFKYVEPSEYDFKNFDTTIEYKGFSKGISFIAIQVLKGHTIKDLKSDTTPLVKFIEIYEKGEYIDDEEECPSDYGVINKFCKTTSNKCGESTHDCERCWNKTILNIKRFIDLHSVGSKPIVCKFDDGGNEIDKYSTDFKYRVKIDNVENPSSVIYVDYIDDEKKKSLYLKYVDGKYKKCVITKNGNWSESDIELNQIIHKILSCVQNKVNK